ncbi:MAG: hypothetical protein AAGG51_19790 [Cyanobacteria bacterium P01_G01_bin.54]
MPRFWVWLVVVGIMGWLTLAPAAAPLGQPTMESLQPIAQVRQQPPRDSVTIQGVVTVPSGAFVSSTGDRGFALQDATGGIYISTAADWHLALNQTIQIRGSVHDDGHGLLVLTPDDRSPVQKLVGPHDPLRPRPVSTGIVGETTEGELLQLQGTITQPLRQDPPYGVGIMLDDGSGPVQVFINQSTGIAIPDWQPGQRLLVQGFSGQYEQYIEVNPRIESDLEAIEF